MDLDATGASALRRRRQRAQAFTLWLRRPASTATAGEAAALIREVLEDNPFTTLQVVLEPAGHVTPEAVRRQIRLRLLRRADGRLPGDPDLPRQVLRSAAGRLNGAKRLIVLLPMGLRPRLGGEWLEDAVACATVVWRGAGDHVPEEMEAHEYAWAE